MSISVGVGLSTAKDTLKAINEACGEAEFNLRPRKASFALIFTTIEYTSAYTLKGIKEIVGDIPLLGSSALHLIYNSAIVKQGLIVILVGLEKVNYTTAYVCDISKKGALRAGEELAGKLLLEVKGKQRNLCLIFGDGLINTYSELIRGLQEKLGLSFPILGANSSSNPWINKTYQYFNAKILNDSCVAVILGGNVSFGFGIRHGFKPLGRPRSITLNKGNTIFEIENKPAIKIYEDYFGRRLSELKKDIRHISVLYPIGIDIPGEEEYLLRNVASFNNDGSISCRGNIPQESSMRLMIATKESCLKAAGQSALEAKNNIEKYALFKNKQIKCAFVFNDSFKYQLLGREAEKEIRTIRDALEGSYPVMGFYTSGEQAPLKSSGYYGMTRCHNQSNLVLTLGD